MVSVTIILGFPEIIIILANIWTVVSLSRELQQGKSSWTTKAIDGNMHQVNPYHLSIPHAIRWTKNARHKNDWKRFGFMRNSLDRFRKYNRKPRPRPVKGRGVHSYRDESSYWETPSVESFESPGHFNYFTEGDDESVYGDIGNTVEEYYHNLANLPDFIRDYQSFYLIQPLSPDHGLTSVDNSEVDDHFQRFPETHYSSSPMTTNGKEHDYSNHYQQHKEHAEKYIGEKYPQDEEQLTDYEFPVVNTPHEQTTSEPDLPDNPPEHYVTTEPSRPQLLPATLRNPPRYQDPPEYYQPPVRNPPRYQDPPEYYQPPVRNPPRYPDPPEYYQPPQIEPPEKTNEPSQDQVTDVPSRRPEFYVPEVEYQDPEIQTTDLPMEEPKYSLPKLPYHWPKPKEQVRQRQKDPWHQVLQQPEPQPPAHDVANVQDRRPGHFFLQPGPLAKSQRPHLILEQRPTAPSDQRPPLRNNCPEQTQIQNPLRPIQLDPIKIVAFKRIPDVLRDPPQELEELEPIRSTATPSTMNFDMNKEFVFFPSVEIESVNDLGVTSVLNATLSTPVPPLGDPFEKMFPNIFQDFIPVPVKKATSKKVTSKPAPVVAQKSPGSSKILTDVKKKAIPSTTTQTTMETTTQKTTRMSTQTTTQMTTQTTTQATTETPVVDMPTTNTTLEDQKDKTVKYDFNNTSTSLDMSASISTEIHLDESQDEHFKKQLLDELMDRLRDMEMEGTSSYVTGMPPVRRSGQAPRERQPNSNEKKILKSGLRKLLGL